MATNTAATDSATTSLTRETVDALLQILSPRCKQALEAALDSQLELSEACTLEIKSAVPQLVTTHQQNQQQTEQSTSSSRTESTTTNNQTIQSFHHAWNRMIHLILNDHMYAGIAAVVIFIVVVLISILVVRFRDAQRRRTSSKKNKKSKLFP